MPLLGGNIIARRHGHVFRMALHNEGDWRVETWQRARRTSCHVSIRQSRMTSIRQSPPIPFLLRTNYWKCDARMQNWQIKSPPAMWKHLSFECLGVVVVALNGKSASMLLESTKNKLKQWLVIEKSVNKCNFFPDILKLEQLWRKITEKKWWRSNSYI